MARRSIACVVLSASVLVACSSSSSPAVSGDSGAPDATKDVTSPPADGGHDSGGDGSTGATTTIAQARSGNVTTPITVVGVVMAIRGTTGDQTEWYIEDPAGGPNSGVGVYCDPAGTTCPKTITAPPAHSLVKVTGSLSTYMGKVELDPTAQTTLAMTTTLPPIPTVTATDLAPGGMSTYRGVFVKIASKLTVDNVTPPALYDTQCQTPPADGGAAEAGAGDAGMPACTGCAPPTYSGFEAADGSGNKVYVENFFFASENLQSSPECLMASGAVPVKVGTTFSSMQGILDFDPYGNAQALEPYVDSDYVTP